jgi:hypothetical protein
LFWVKKVRSKSRFGKKNQSQIVIWRQKRATAEIASSGAMAPEPDSASMTIFQGASAFAAAVARLT